eukprot:6171952-Pleurochrysis_carterae.AAC.2
MLQRGTRPGGVILATELVKMHKVRHSTDFDQAEAAKVGLALPFAVLQRTPLLFANDDSEQPAHGLLSRN